MVTYHKTLMGLIFKLENHASITQEFVPKNMAQWITLLCGIAEFNPWHPHGGGENHLLQATPSPKPNQTKPIQTNPQEILEGRRELGSSLCFGKTKQN